MRAASVNTVSKADKPIAIFDRWLAGSIVLLLGIGLLMVASASMMVSAREFHTPFYFFIRQAAYMVVGIVLALCVARIPLEKIEKYNQLCLLLALFSLALVLIPGIGHVVNGSRRWLSLGILNVQVSELAKLLIVIYMASYLSRFRDQLKDNLAGFFKPMAIIACASFLLLLEPDFGATVVIVGTTLGMMFLAGVKLRHFVMLLAIVLVAFAALAILSPYRLLRLTSFLNPWENQYGSGYQLTQSLIAIGRGGLFGVGLGNSIEKLFYLPEAHTDFLFAVLAEELGLVGVIAVLSLFSLFLWRVLYMGYQCEKLKLYFNAYLAYGFGLWLSLQLMINLGVNTGVLPTKGLTLPFMSYGGSSLLVNFLVLGMILRIDHELRIEWVSGGYRRRKQS